MNSPKKILIATPLYPPEIGGPATYCKFLENNLPKGEFELHIVHFGKVKHLPYVIRHLAYFWNVWSAAADTDIVYALDPLGVGIPAGLAAKLRKKRFFMRIAGDRAWETAVQKYRVGDSLDKFSKSRKYSFGIRLLKRGQEFGASLAEKIIVPSEYLKKMVSNWGTDPNKIKVILNAFEAVSIPESKEDLRSQFHWHGPVLMSAGRIVPWKGFTMLIRMMIEVRKEIPDAVLYIAGDGPEREKLSRLVKELSLRNAVIFLGNMPKSDLLRHIKAADVFLLNTFYEGLSHQLLEALSVGTPVISTRVGGNPELIQGESEGVLVAYNDQEAFLRETLRVIREKNIVSPDTKVLDTFSVSRAVSSFIKECQ